MYDKCLFRLLYESVILFQLAVSTAMNMTRGNVGRAHSTKLRHILYARVYSSTVGVAMRCGEVIIIHDLAVTTRKWKRVFGNKKTDLPRLVLSSADTTSSQSHVLHFKKDGPIFGCVS